MLTCAGRYDSPVAKSGTQDRSFYVVNALLSVAVTAFLVWLLLVNQGADVEADLSFLPAVNAGLNSVAAALIVAGWVAIRSGRRDLHRRLMLSAAAASGLFLVSYVTYHYAVGDTHYTGEGAIRAVYFGVLITHVLLSTVIVPMVLSAFFFAFKGRFGTHKKITRILTPIWLYVSVTGVVIFLMLRAG